MSQSLYLNFDFCWFFTLWSTLFKALFQIKMKSQTSSEFIKTCDKALIYIPTFVNFSHYDLSFSKHFFKWKWSLRRRPNSSKRVTKPLSKSLLLLIFHTMIAPFQNAFSNENEVSDVVRFHQNVSQGLCLNRYFCSFFILW